jgi:hypothetical protein
LGEFNQSSQQLCKERLQWVFRNDVRLLTPVAALVTSIGGAFALLRSSSEGAGALFLPSIGAGLFA